MRLLNKDIDRVYLVIVFILLIGIIELFVSIIPLSLVVQGTIRVPIKQLVTLQILDSIKYFIYAIVCILYIHIMSDYHIEYKSYSVILPASFLGLTLFNFIYIFEVPFNPEFFHYVKLLMTIVLELLIVSALFMLFHVEKQYYKMSTNIITVLLYTKLVLIAFNFIGFTILGYRHGYGYYNNNFSIFFTFLGYSYPNKYTILYSSLIHLGLTLGLFLFLFIRLIELNNHNKLNDSCHQ